MKLVQANLSSNEILAETVFQQQAARINACVEMTGIIAEGVGASSSRKPMSIGAAQPKH